MEDSISSTNHKNNAYFPGDGLEFSSEDSSWSLYIENSVSCSNKENLISCFGSESSSAFSGAAAAASEDYMNPNDDPVASTSSVAKRRKIRATFIDHDLEDTATSPASNSKVQDQEQLNMNLQETDCVLNMLRTTQHGKQDYASLFQVKQNIFNHTKEITHPGYIMKDINYAGLKEKGLCLVPLSLLFQVS